MTRAELEKEEAEARRHAFALGQRLDRYKKADAIRNASTVLTINNTTVAWTGNGGITDPALVTRVREMIAAYLESAETP